MDSKAPNTRSQSERAYDRIEEMIVTGALAPETMISEGALVEVLDCGRTPIRDALQRLQFEGFVEIQARRGIIVTPVDVGRQLELLEVRRPLEEQMVRLAARRADETQRKEMRCLAAEIEAAIESDDRSRYLTINRAIHELEAEATGNRFLRRQVTIIHKLSRRFWYSVITDTESFEIAGRLHARILRAIADGDTDQGVAACRQLLDALENVTRRSLETYLG